MSFFVFMVLNLFWRLYKCDDITFSVNIESLIEFDENGDEISSKTSFNTEDWINATSFQSILSNHDHLQMNIAIIPKNNEFQYSINIPHWPWDNKQDQQNSIEFCFYISIPNTNDLQFESSYNPSIDIINNNNDNNINTIHICHRFYHNKTFQFAHIYYQYIDNQWLYATEYDDDESVEPYSTLSQLLYTNLMDEEIPSSSTSIDQHMVWLFGVFIAIGFVVCIFISLILYLMKEGFFDDEPSSSSNKRKKSKRNTVTIMDKKKKRLSTNSYLNTTSSTETSPKKNLRINVTYHSPDHVPNSPIDSADIINLSSTDHHDTHIQHTKNIHPDLEHTVLIEGDEGQQTDKQDIDDNNTHNNNNNNNNNNDDTPIIISTTIGTPTTNSSNETEFEESMIQYIITCSNDNAVTPVPFI